MKASTHAVASLVLSFALYIAVRSVEASLFCFLAGVLLDGDHLLDYLWWSEEKKFRTFFILGPDYFDDPHSLDKLLHSVDLFAFAAIPIVLCFPFMGLGIAVGFGGHIILDIFGFGFTPLYFFLLYRVAVGKSKIVSLREAVLKKDGFKCVDCKMTDNLQIHRGLKLGRVSGWDKVEEWTTVCENCHMKKHMKGMFY